MHWLAWPGDFNPLRRTGPSDVTIKFKNGNEVKLDDAASATIRAWWARG